MPKKNALLAPPPAEKKKRDFLDDESDDDDAQPVSALEQQQPKLRVNESFATRLEVRKEESIEVGENEQRLAR